MRKSSLFLVVTFLVKVAMVVTSFFATFFSFREAFVLFSLSASAAIVAQLAYFLLAIFLLLFALGWLIALLFSVMFFFIPVGQD